MQEYASAGAVARDGDNDCLLPTAIGTPLVFRGELPLSLLARLRRAQDVGFMRKVEFSRDNLDALRRILGFKTVNTTNKIDHTETHRALMREECSGVG